VDLAALTDVSSRAMRGWNLRRHLDQALPLTAWRRALVQQRPAIHHADQGVPSAATASIQGLHASGVQSSLATAGAATEDGDAERLMRPITAEDVTPHDDMDLHDASLHLGRFPDDVDQHKRVHAALGYLTPVAFETQWVQQPSTVLLK
jgi:putative transposase